MNSTTKFFFAFVLATAVGILGFQFLRHMDPVDLPWIGQVDFGSLLGLPDPPPVERLEVAKNRLLEMAQEEGSSAGHATDAAALIAEVDKAFAEVATQEAADPSSLAFAKSFTLQAKYAAARINASQYGRDFWDFAEEIKSDAPKSDAAASAALMQVLVKTDFTSPRASTIEQDLAKYAKGYPKKYGVSLYCLVSGELAANQHDDTAERILRHGIKVYDSTPVAAMLVNQLADLRIAGSEPKAKGVDSYMQMLRVMKNRALARSTRSAPTRTTIRRG